MISMTTYWQQFKDCIDNLPAGSEEYTSQMSTARKMIAIGLTIEQLGISEIQQVVNNLYEITKLFEYNVLFKTPKKEYQFYLPKIINTGSLLFAIMYYQHLSNYKDVSYQGSIYWFRQRVIDTVNNKKIATAFQAEAMLKEISHYCQSQNITINESQLLRNNDELAKDYILRISGIFSQKSPVIEIDSNQLDEKDSSQPNEQDSNQSDEIARLEQLLKDLTNKQSDVKAKLDCFANKLAEFEQTQQRYTKLNKEWQNKSHIIKMFYWLISLVYEPLPIRNLNKALEQCTKAEEAINQELAPDKSVGSYGAELTQQLEEIHTEYKKTKKEMKLQIKLKESKQTKEEIICQKDPIVTNTEAAIVTNTEAVIDTKTNTDTATVILDTAQEKNEHELISNFNHYYGFFKEHLPNRQMVQAVAVGAAAIVIQHLAYS